MFTRISKRSQYLVGLVSLPLAACGSGKPDAGDTASRRDDAAVMHVPCAKGAAALSPDCTIEQARGADGVILTLRHADGGFRRLRVSPDGRGVVAADGAERAQVTASTPGSIDVALGTDRYRLPVTVQPGANGS